MKRIALVWAGIFLWCAVGIAAQEAVVAPPESLVIDGVPKIPVGLAETAGRYGEFRNAGLADFPEAELVKWKSFDGKTITGFLYRPPAKFAGKRPVLVVIHGGPERQSLPTFLGRQNYLLNEMGIALIYPNVRGSTGYGKTFTLLDNGFQREDTYKDINALLDWIAERPRREPDWRDRWKLRWAHDAGGIDIL